jgi:hypothetical protein
MNSKSPFSIGNMGFVSIYCMEKLDKLVNKRERGKRCIHQPFLYWQKKFLPKREIQNSKIK